VHEIHEHVAIRTVHAGYTWKGGLAVVRTELKGCVRHQIARFAACLLAPHRKQIEILPDPAYRRPAQVERGHGRADRAEGPVVDDDPVGLGGPPGYCATPSLPRPSVHTQTFRWRLRAHGCAPR